MHIPAERAVGLLIVTLSSIFVNILFCAIALGNSYNGPIYVPNVLVPAAPDQLSINFQPHNDIHIPGSVQSSSINVSTVTIIETFTASATAIPTMTVVVTNEGFSTIAPSSSAMALPPIRPTSIDSSSSSSISSSSAAPAVLTITTTPPGPIVSVTTLITAPLPSSAPDVAAIKGLSQLADDIHSGKYTLPMTAASMTTVAVSNEGGSDGNKADAVVTATSTTPSPSPTPVPKPEA